MTPGRERTFVADTVTSGAKCVTCRSIIPAGRACISFTFGNVVACTDRCAREVPASDRFYDENNGVEWFWKGSHARPDIVADFAEDDDGAVTLVRGTISSVGPDGEDGPWFAPADNGRFEFWQVGE